MKSVKNKLIFGQDGVEDRTRVNFCFFFKKKLKQSKLPNTSSVKKKSNTDVSVHWFFMRIGFLWDEDSILQVRPTDRVL